MAIITLIKDPFSSKKEQHRITECVAVKDAVRFDRDNAVIIVNGNRVDENFVLKEEDICLIEQLPAGGGGQVVAGVLTGGLYNVADAITYGISGSHIHELIMSGLKDLLTPDMDLDSATSDVDTLQKIPQLKGAKNQSGLDKPVPLILGKHLLTPYYCGSPYTFIDPTDGSDGENQYFCGLYMIGFNTVKLTDLKLGELLLASNAAGVFNGSIAIDANSIYSDYSAQLEVQQSAEVSLYTQKVVEEQLSIELSYPEAGFQRIPVRFSARCPMKIELEVTLGNGLIGYSAAGAVENRNIQLRAQWRPLNGTDDQWADFPMFLNANSYASGVSTITRKKKKQMRFVAVKEFTFSEISAINTDYVELRLFRDNVQSSDGRSADDVYWSAIRTWCFDKKATFAASAFVPQVPVVEDLRVKTCRLGFRIKAGDDVSGTIDSLNMIVLSVARTWTGAAWTTMEAAKFSGTVSQNPASVALLALQQPHLGHNPYVDSELDMDELAELYEFCELKGFAVNGILTSQMLESGLLDKLLTTCRSQIYIKDGRYAPLIDRERLYPVTVLNQQNTMSATNSKEFDELPDGLRIKFVNEDDGYQTNEIYVMYDGKSSSDPESVFQDVELPFATNYQHVWKLGRYVLACMKLRPETWIRKVSLEGYSIPFGSLVAVQDDTIMVGLNGGGIIKSVVQAAGYITRILCDAYFDMEEGGEYGVKIIQANGLDNPLVRTEKVVTVAGYSNEFTFVDPIAVSSRIKPEAGNTVAFGEYSKITIDAIVLGKTPADNNTFELTLVPYVADIYAADSGTIPKFDSKITKPVSPSKIPEVPKKVITVPDVQESIGGAIADRPTYTEIATGFTAAGLVIVPVQLNATAVGGFRFITITWAKQSNLSNLKEYQIQCSENALNWFAPSLDGSGTNGHGTVDNAYFSTTSPMLVHPNIPPAGTEEAPVGRLLYYRIRQVTALDSVSEWSAVVAATTKLADSGDYAANSISLNALKTSELYALFATLSETLIIDPNAGLAAQNSDYTDGDSRTLLNARELLFQYVVSGSWVTIVRLALEGLCSNQVYSKDKLFITNDDMAGRRARGFDVGLPYLSENSHVCHYDTDILDQTGATYWTLSGSGALVGKEDGITPAIVAVAPYATEAKSLFGNFRLQKDIGVTNVFTLDFWIRYYYNENQELFRVGSENEYVSIDVLNSEPYYNEDTFQYNDEATDGVWYNEIQGAVARVVYCLNGVFDIRYIQDSQGNTALTTGTWYHIGVIDSGATLVVLVNASRFEFESPSVRTESLGIDINPMLGQFLIDELFVDATIAETESAFIANTTAKKPWAKLSDAHDWFVLDAKNPAFLKTNIFESQVFKDAVLEIAAPKV